MVGKNRILQCLTLVLLILLVGIGACNKSEPPTVEMVNPEIPLVIYPGADTLSIGDTLWIEAEFPDSVQDYFTDQWIKLLPGFYFLTSIDIRSLDDPEGTYLDQPGATGDFTVVNEKGTLDFTSGRFGRIELLESGAGYSLKVGLIPNRAGTKSFLLFNSHEPDDQVIKGYIDQGLDNSGERIIPVLNFIVFTMNDGESNHSLYTSSIQTVCCDPEQIQIEVDTRYTFHVKE